MAGRPTAGRPAPGRLPQPVPRGAGWTSTNLREYEPGDDLRHIEWNVTARMDTPYVREYIEDREVTAWLLLDHSASMGFGPVDRQKDLVLAEVATTLALVLTRRGNRVGMVVFDQDVERILPARSGRNQVLQIADVLLDRRNARATADAAPAPRARRRRGRPENGWAPPPTWARCCTDPPGWSAAAPSSSSSPTSSASPGGSRLSAGWPGATRWSPYRSATRVRTSCPTSGRSTSRTPRPGSRSSSIPPTGFPVTAQGGRRRASAALRGGDPFRRRRPAPDQNRRGPGAVPGPHRSPTPKPAAMSLAWPWALLGLLALPLVVVAYRRLLRQQAERRADLARQGLVVPTPRRDRWRHVAPVLLVAALAVMLLAWPVAAVAEPRREGTVILAFDVSTSMAAKDMAEPSRRGQGAAGRFVEHSRRR